MVEKKTKTVMSDIEDFSVLTGNIRLMGYDPVNNKSAYVPLSKVNSNTAYAGCKWKIGDSNTEGTPFGDLDMIKEMYSVLQLGGYLVQNDHTRRKLHRDNHFKFADGGVASLDGSMGHYQWGWGVPWYYAQWTDSTYQYEAFSLSPIPGHYNYYIPVASIAAAGASALDRTNNILVSYCNRTAQYRGGNNNADYDGKWNTQMGKPVVNVAGNSLQRYAEKNGERWGASMHMMIFCIGVLTRIFFHNRNIQKAYNATLTADGLHQGGLGMGINNYNTDFGNQYATVDIDALADKGDALGVFSVSLTKDDGSTYTMRGIPCFFGLKNFYRYIWVMLHGCNIQYTADGADVYALDKWTKTTVPTTTVTGLTKIGSIPQNTGTSDNWLYIKSANLDHMLMYPTEWGGSVSTYFADAMYMRIVTSGLFGLLALGSANSGGFAGVGCLHGYNGPSGAGVYGGAALCEAAEDWSTQPTWVAA